MFEVPVTNILVKKESGERRHRKEVKHGALQSMKFSIESFGQLQPIIVEPVGDGTFYLIAGYTRLRAHEELKYKTINALLIDELTPLQREELELEENVQRTNLTFQERSYAFRSIMALKQDQNIMSASSIVKGYTQKDLAKELGINEATLSQDIKLANAMDSYPELADCSSRAEALRELRKLNRKSGNKVMLSQEYIDSVIKENYYYADDVEDVCDNQLDTFTIHLLLWDVSDGLPINH